MTTALDIKRLYVKRAGGILSQVTVKCERYVRDDGWQGYKATLATCSDEISHIGPWRGWTLDHLFERVNAAFPPDDSNQMRHAFNELIEAGKPKSMSNERWMGIKHIAKRVEEQAEAGR